tara:strand:- start:13669 stop:14106 length:438 start_codon:yes stop_codon:yes gene_type:complete
MKLSALYEDSRADTKVARKSYAVDWGDPAASSDSRVSPWAKQADQEDFQRTGTSKEEKPSNHSQMSKRLTPFPYDPNGRHITSLQTQLYYIIKSEDSNFVNAFKKAQSYSKQIRAQSTQADYVNALKVLLKKGVIQKIGKLYRAV